MNDKNKIYHFENAFIDSAWANDVRMHVGANGLIVALETNCGAGKDDIEFFGHAIPAMVNAHSHAFQRAFAGLAENKPDDEDDDFWSWRKAMYGFLASLTPDDVATISAQLYVEMLKCGYTSVAEFHYLHNDINGNAYSDKAIMSKAIIDGAGQAGIGLNLVPILYQRSGFENVELSSGQKRFYLDDDDYAEVYDSIDCEKSLGFHSLRAVSLGTIQKFSSAFKDIKVHIHIAEQQMEVDDCLSHHSVPPVQYLYENADVDERWCLVHATHINDDEIGLIARSKAVVIICPSTEANLGDGIFPTAQFISENGLFAIGSDSHVTLNPVEELRQLEYMERLQRKKRIILGGGKSLWRRAVSGGAQVMDKKSGLRIGARADVLVLDAAHPSLIGRKGDEVFDTLVLTSHANLIKHVLASGKWVVKDGKHINEENILSHYSRTINSLMRHR